MHVSNSLQSWMFTRWRWAWFLL